MILRPFSRFAALPFLALLTGLLLLPPLLAGAETAPAPAAAAAPAAPAATTRLPGAAAPGGKAERQPLDVQADNAIEWHQDQKAYVARGNASAKRGDSTVFADVLTAYYRETKDKGTEVFRVKAEGNVRVVTPNQQVFGDLGVYDVDQQVAVMTGGNLRLITPNEVVTAKESLEYYEATKLVAARGDAIALRGQDIIRADILVGRFKEGQGGASEMERIDGTGNVIITTPTDVARCQKVMYHVTTEIALLTGDVKITRADNQINGDAAEMNMKTKVNRVLSAGRRIDALLLPQEQAQGDGKGKPAAKGATPAAPAAKAATPAR